MAQEETFHDKIIFEERRKNCMKKQRRIIAMILTLTLVIAFAAMNVSAAVIEVPLVQPRAVCSRCGSSGLSTTTEERYTLTNFHDSCSAVGFYHAHYTTYYTSTCTCRTCGYVVDTTNYSIESCPYGGY